MQYLITEDERKNLVNKDELTKADLALAAARKKLLLLAGFDCIHDHNGRNTDGYCSDCPCSPINHVNDYATWSRVCWLDKNYPK